MATLRPRAADVGCSIIVSFIVLSLSIPTTAAFAPLEPVDIRYEASTGGPLLFSIGALDFEGSLDGGFVAMGLSEATIGPVDQVDLIGTDNDGNLVPGTHADATIIIHDGGMVWFEEDEGAAFELDWRAPYGVLATLPGGSVAAEASSDATADAEDAGPFAGGGAHPLLVAGADLGGVVTFNGGTSQIALLTARVSVLDADGVVVTGWDRRIVNDDLGLDQVLDAASGDLDALGGDETQAGTDTAGGLESSGDADQGSTDDERSQIEQDTGLTREELKALAATPQGQALLAAHGYTAEDVEALDAEHGDAIDEALAENADALTEMLPDGLDLALLQGLLTITGTATATMGAEALLGQPGVDADLSLTVSPADEDAFLQTFELLQALGATLEGTSDDEAADAASGGSTDGIEAQLGLDIAPLAGLSGTLNGAVLLLPIDTTAQQEGGPGPGSEEGEGGLSVLEATTSTIGSRDLQTGAFALLRGDATTVRWSDHEVAVSGEPRFAATENGVPAAAPAAVGPMPMLSIALWLLALGALVTFYTRRPVDAVLLKKWRYGGLGTHLGMLLVASIVWDFSFRATFGTSILMILGGAVPDSADNTALFVAGIAGLQLSTMNLAYALFGAPVRVAGGTALRYVLKGKGGAGYAKATAWLVTLGLGPLYVMWLLSEIADRVIAAVGG